MSAQATIKIEPVSRPIHGRIRPPGSKSITNRALVCAALANGTSTLTGALDSEDTRVMIDSLGRLGIRVELADKGTTLRVHGCGGQIPAASADLFVGNSGTTIRFLTAVCTLGHGTYRLDGIERMRERPISDLVDALQQLGATVKYKLREGFPPIVVEGHGLNLKTSEGETRVKGDVSSQFLSALLMVIPASGEMLRVYVDGELVSQPYVAMTLQVIKSFGGSIGDYESKMFESYDNLVGYRSKKYAVEPDASAASYFWATAAITGGEVTVEGLGKKSLQGDVQFVECLKQMGCDVSHVGGWFSEPAITVTGRGEHGIDINMNAISDTAQTLAVVALFATGPTTIRGVAHIRHKETDRIGDLARELRKFGATVDELPDGLRITPPVKMAPGPIEIETYNDHRMAMSFALAGLIHPGVVIRNPSCTAKTYPSFFDDLATLCRSSIAR